MDKQQHLRSETQAAEAPVQRSPLEFWSLSSIVLVLAAGAYAALRLHALPHAPERVLIFLERFSLGVGALTLLLIIYRLIDQRLCTIPDAALRYNVRRIGKLVLFGLGLVIALTVLFANWYAALTSLGVISIILGFSLQTTLASFIGWIYILAKRPYWVGDRITIDDASGDVIDVTYLDTTLWEVGGPMINSRHHPSGRVIKFPNSRVLTTAVVNSSWALFPYVWNEITFQVAYDSDLPFVSEVMQHAAEEEVGESMRAEIGKYRALLARTPVDEVEVRERPSVHFRVNANTWLDATVRYLVDPKQAGRVKSGLIVKMLERLNAEPARVKFPKGDAR
ncbi:MAG TPA: mechanosensitive ion channel domain-containing protein [Rhodanobacteraceae bacterium]|jgi:small-conductance mechanosensitive channel|nr:mechanosensitive ion channel domain-containing protein [Rhodanobacteraceae bacterium]